VQVLAAGQPLRPRFFRVVGTSPSSRRPANECLSQWYPASFDVQGVPYANAEQFMMAEKARLFRDDDALDRILRTSAPEEAKALGKKVARFVASIWEARREDIVLRGNLAKFGQDRRLESFLLGTGTDVLIEASPKDAIWGIGLSDDDPRAHDPSQWRGRNLLGFTLMAVRDILTTKRFLDIPRDSAARLGHQAVEIARLGQYTAPSGSTVSIASDLEAARSGTVEYGPDDSVPAAARRGTTGPVIEVTCETTLAAARRLLDAGHQPTALNFAAATHPGGGFLRGARAQEEYLARSSGLYACLDGRRMYAELRDRPDPFYDDFVIHTPAVPVFRGDAGALLDASWNCGIITSPAVQANGVRKYCPQRADEIEPVMRRRLRRVLQVAAAHDCRALVLGAWGCGAFGNDPALIARLFREELEDRVGDSFDRVVFAVTDWSPERRFVGPFECAFAPPASVES